MQRKFKFLFIGFFTFFLSGSCLSTANAPLAVVVLQVFVLDDNGNVQPNALIRLYESEKDFADQKNHVFSEKANSKGKAVFRKGLEEKVYYVLAKKGKKDNTGGAFKTERLDKNRVNKINIIISSGPSLPGY